MSFGSFLLGLLLLGVGFLAVWKTTWFRNNMGDPGIVFGLQNYPWMSWKLVGLLLMLLGFLIAFGLLQAFMAVTIGGLFQLNTP